LFRTRPTCLFVKTVFGFLLEAFERIFQGLRLENLGCLCLDQLLLKPIPPDCNRIVAIDMVTMPWTAVFRMPSFLITLNDDNVGTAPATPQQPAEEIPCGFFGTARWVHKMRNILEKARKCDYDEVKAGAQAIYLAESRAQAEAAFRRFRARWQRLYPGVVKRLGHDLPELLAFFAFPRHLWRKLRTTNVIERCFVEVRRRTRPMVCFVNVESVDRIIYSIFHRFNLDWKTRTLNLFTQAA